VTSFDEVGRTALRDRLVGRWAAGKLGLSGQAVDAYVDALAAGGLENGDIFGRVRKDFDAAGVAVSDGDIATAITDCTVKAGRALATASGGPSAAAAVALKRNLTSP
jgi:hypothetical protein